MKPSCALTTPHPCWGRQACGGAPADGNCLGHAQQARLYQRRRGGDRRGNRLFNALLLQMGRHPAPLLASVAHDPLPASASTAAPAGTIEPVAPYAPPTPTSEYSTASAAAPPAGDISRATLASAPVTTSSIAPAAQDKQHQSSTPNGERDVSAALGPDLRIGALLRGKPDDGIAPRARCPDRAREAPDMCSSPMASKMAATFGGSSQFRACARVDPATKISSKLVKQLTAAARG